MGISVEIKEPSLKALFINLGHEDQSHVNTLAEILSIL